MRVPGPINLLSSFILCGLHLNYFKIIYCIWLFVSLYFNSSRVETNKLLFIYYYLFINSNQNCCSFTNKKKLNFGFGVLRQFDTTWQVSNFLSLKNHSTLIYTYTSPFVKLTADTGTKIVK